MRKTNPNFDFICSAFDQVGSAIATGFAKLTCNKLIPSSPVWLSMCHSTYEIPSTALKKSLQRILERLPFSVSFSENHPIPTFILRSVIEKYSGRDAGGIQSNSGELCSEEFVPLRVRRSSQYIPAFRNLTPITSDEYSRFFDADVQTWSSELTAPQYHIFKKTYRDVVNRSSWDTISYTDAIVIGQICPNYVIVRLVKNADANKDFPGLNFDSTPSNFRINNYIKTSSSRFLEIEYRCGNRSPIAIDVPKSHYLVGNELLSKTYILRYLEHLPIYVGWTFDESYSLRIVDDDSEVFSIDGNQYILLANDGYKIINSDQEPEEEKIEPFAQDN